MEMDTYKAALARQGAIAGAKTGYALGEAGQQRDTLGSVASDMETESDRLHKLYDMITRIADHIDGATPQQVGADVAKLDAPPHSLLDNLRRKQRAIGMTINRCETAAHRISNALGI